MTKGLATRRPFIVDINTRSLPLQLVENTWWWICHSSRKSEKNFKALISSYLTLALFFFTLLLRIQPNFSSVTFASLVLILYNIWSLNFPVCPCWWQEEIWEVLGYPTNYISFLKLPSISMLSDKVGHVQGGMVINTYYLNTSVQISCKYSFTDIPF